MTLSEIYEEGARVIEEKGAQQRLRGVETEYVLRHNEEVFSKYRFVQRAINSIQISTNTALLDVKLETPIVMSSITGVIPQIRPDGFVVVARALKAVGSMMSVGSPIAGIRDLVDVGVPIIQTVKPWADRSLVMKQVMEAQEAGVTWVGIEVDAGQGTKVLDHEVGKDFFPLSVDELKEIRQKVTRPLLLKGILSPWDAERALEIGADVIIVSNHGAHTIDFLPHPLEVMGEITSVIRGRIPIIVDGGFRRGTDVLKGLAVGAKAIGILRPILYGLAAGGEEGAKAVVQEMTRELVRVMTMTGVRDADSAHQGILLHDG